MSDSTSLSLAIGLQGAGRHPAAWRDPEARPDALFTARYWREAIVAAERAGADFVTLDDGFGVRPPLPHELSTSGRPVRTDLVNGRLDTVLVAARIAPLTTRIGLLPTVTVTHSEPFHTSKAIATLDYVSSGRAGVLLAVDDSPDNVRLFGRRDAETISDRSALHREAADYAEVLSRLWDSWEDDAEIRDASTGRFIDRDRVHHIDFDGEFFAVRGPSITPRPPQGRPPIAATASAGERSSREFLDGSADIGFFPNAEDRAASDTTAGDSDREGLRRYDDLVVYLDDTQQAASDRRACYDDWLGAEFDDVTQTFVGTATGLADLIEERNELGGRPSGIRLHPAAITHDLARIADDLAPELLRRSLVVDAASNPAGPQSLRDRQGLVRPANRYARAAVGGGVR
ncbi:LLM class flavin-dependent oxidoreductase [Gordonia otitidis]|uniref:Oxidoreductase n=1 Tax=Gordonia otitidis (strain DSM 44809 / CCUG 52243 / JCM 12355 / NBRC 100426 / IFM 10032) TaxID=1108044 RepID=H5TR61_GORO1|nr:LLM class flavin-dependent oxidoreductase [Gordonia otitidis]GAB35969.1 putative oxidoreductase [Gordonia otitidis NBRC 100426]